MTTYGGYIMGRFTVPSGVTISANNTVGGTDTVTVPAANYFIGGQATTTASLIADFESALNTDNPNGWTVSLSTGAGGTGRITINNTNVPWSITWTSTLLRDLLGFTANISGVSSAQTGANQARGLWLPDCPMNVDGNFAGTPRVTDLRQTESPTGVVIGHVGNVKYRHRGLRWSHVPTAYTWLADEGSVANTSLERFLLDAHWGQGHSWFSPSAKCQIQIHSGTELGEQAVDGWYLKGGSSMEEIVRRAVDGWDGLWSVQFAEAVSDG